MRKPTVAIVGRPNVGKSTLFNRLVGRKVAIVDDTPGVTRDRREGDAVLLGCEFRIIDTAGFEDEDAVTLPGRMRAQTQAAVRDADVALFLIDGRAGVTPLDEEIARWLRSEKTPAIAVANKAESRAGEAGRLEAEVARLQAELDDAALYTAPGGVQQAKALSRQLEVARAQMERALEEWAAAGEAVEVAR